MYTGLSHTHSFLRYVLLALLIVAIVNAFRGWFRNTAFDRKDEKLSLFTMIVTHVQLLIGLGLYFVSPLISSGLVDMGKAMKDASLRFWVLEHPLMMIVGIVLITVGHSLGKRAERDVVKHRRVAVFFLLALLLIFFSIPWPFMREIFTGRGYI